MLDPIGVVLYSLLSLLCFSVIVCCAYTLQTSRYKASLVFRLAHIYTVLSICFIAALLLRWFLFTKLVEALGF